MAVVIPMLVREQKVAVGEERAPALLVLALACWAWLSIHSHHDALYLL